MIFDSKILIVDHNNLSDLLKILFKNLRKIIRFKKHKQIIYKLLIYIYNTFLIFLSFTLGYYFVNNFVFDVRLEMPISSRCRYKLMDFTEIFEVKFTLNFRN